MINVYKLFHGNDKEDEFLVNRFDLPDFGTFVDIGAGPDGIQGSNSYHFEKNGWRCLCADADPRNYKRLKENRKNVYTGVVSNKLGKVKLNLGNESPDVSGVYKTQSNGIITEEVDSTTLYDLLVSKRINEIDILSIDTEGSEVDVWESMRPQYYKPKILVIEFLTQGKVNESLPAEIEKYGYKFVANVGANLIFEYDNNH